MIRSLLALALLLPLAARASEIRILTTGAYRAILTDLAPTIERETGNRLVIQNDTAGAVVEKIRTGANPDLVIVTPAGAKSLETLLSPPQPLAKVGIGVAVRNGAPRPAIDTEAAIRAAVLAARAPAWIDPAAGGSSGIYLAKLWQTWGIAAELAPKAILVNGGLVADAILDGRADLAFQQLSELTGHGVTVLGPLPPSIQNYTIYVGAIPLAATNRTAAAEILARLTGPEAQTALAAHGMQTP